MRAQNIGDVLANQTVNQDVPWYRQLLNALPGIATTYLSVEQQRKLLQLNIERARLGQPAISVDEYASAGVNVGVNRSTQNTIIIVALGIGATILLSRQRR